MKEKNTLIKRIIFLILIILTSLMIFGFSAQNGEESSSISRKIATIVISIFNKNGQEAAVLGAEGVIRKLAHFSIYTLLGTWIMAYADTFKVKEKNKMILTIILGFLYACSDELHQGFIGGRSASFIDVIIDTLGVSFGLFVMLFIKESKKNITKILQKD